MRPCFILSLIIFVLLGGLYSAITISDLYELESKSDTSAESTVLNIEEPLHSTKHIDALPSVMLREKARELRQHYNRTFQICRAVRARMDFYSRKGALSHETEAMVETNLKVLEKRNELLKKRFVALDAYAQKTYAENLIRDSAPAEEERERVLSAENDKLLRSVELPMSFK